MSKKNKEEPKKKKFISKKVNKLIRKFKIPLIIISFSGLLIYLAEEVVFPDTRINIEDKALQFQNHEIFLREKLLTTIENIANSDSFSGIQLTQKRTLDQAFLIKVYEHQTNLTKTMRILGYYSLLVSNVFDGIFEILKHSPGEIKNHDGDGFKKDSNKLLELSTKFKNCTKKIEEKKDQINYFFSPRPENMSVEDQSEVILKITEFGKSLYFDDCFLVSLDGSSSKAIDEFANSIISIINYYSIFLKTHKVEVQHQNTIKTILIFLLLLLASSSFFYIERENS